MRHVFLRERDDYFKASPVQWLKFQAELVAFSMKWHFYMKEQQTGFILTWALDIFLQRNAMGLSFQENQLTVPVANGEI